MELVAYAKLERQREICKCKETWRGKSRLFHLTSKFRSRAMWREQSRRNGSRVIAKMESRAWDCEEISQSQWYSIQGSRTQRIKAPKLVGSGFEMSNLAVNLPRELVRDVEPVTPICRPDASSACFHLFASIKGHLGRKKSPRANEMKKVSAWRCRDLSRDRAGQVRRHNRLNRRRWMGVVTALAK